LLWQSDESVHAISPYSPLSSSDSVPQHTFPLPHCELALHGAPTSLTELLGPQLLPSLTSSHPSNFVSLPPLSPCEMQHSCVPNVQYVVVPPFFPQ
jgi:hypothetical protein